MQSHEAGRPRLQYFALARRNPQSVAAQELLDQASPHMRTSPVMDHPIDEGNFIALLDLRILEKLLRGFAALGKRHCFRKKAAEAAAQIVEFIRGFVACSLTALIADQVTLLILLAAATPARIVAAGIRLPAHGPGWLDGLF